MHAGTFRDRVKIQKRTVTQKATGVQEVWSDVGIRWARVVPLAADARLRYDQLRSEVTHEVEFRGTVALSVGDHRLIWMNRGSRMLEITTPPEDRDGLKRFTVVGVKEHNH